MRDVEADGHAAPDLPWRSSDVFDAGSGEDPGPVTGRVRPVALPTGVELFGYAFSAGSAAAIVACVAARRGDRPRMIVTANIDHIVQLTDDDAFRGAYDRAAARTLDGMPLVWLARARSGRTVERVTGHDLLACVLADPPLFAARVFLVSSRQAIADAVAERLRAAGLPREAIASAIPPFGFEQDDAYSTALAARIRAHGTGLLIMGVGAPKSEIWVDRQGARLGRPVVFCVGDALAVAAGCMPRAPLAIQHLGLEWAFRFLLAPRRLFHRYFIKSWRFLRVMRRGQV